MFKFYESSRTRHTGRSSANLFLQVKWDLTNYENHRFNVAHAHHLLDNKPPRIFPHLYYRPKRLQLELERFAKIQRANNALLQRIATIQRDGAWSINKNYYEIKSLNTRKRQMDWTQVCYENQVMLSRVMDVHPVHITSKYQDEYLEFKKLKANVQKYPKNWRLGVIQLGLLKKRIRAQVWASRTGRYKPGMDKRVTLMALKKDATEIQRQKEKVEAEKEAEEQRETEHQARLHLAKELKMKEEERREKTQKWRDARAERLHYVKEQKDEIEIEQTSEKKRQDDARKKRTTSAKKKLEHWKTLHEEEQEAIKQKQFEERKKKIDEQEKKRASEGYRKKKLAEWREKKAIEDEKKKEEKVRQEKEKKEDLQNRIRDRMQRRGEVPPPKLKLKPKARNFISVRRAAPERQEDTLNEDDFELFNSNEKDDATLNEREGSVPPSQETEDAMQNGEEARVLSSTEDGVINEREVPLSSNTVPNEAEELPPSLDTQDTAPNEAEEMPQSRDAEDTSSNEAEEFSPSRDTEDTAPYEAEEFLPSRDTEDTASNEAEEVPPSTDTEDKTPIREDEEPPTP